jgi:hypothetical protein
MDATGGVWGPPTTLVDASHQALGDLAGNNGYAQVEAVACNASGVCAAGGFYYDAGNVQHAFVVDETGAGWSSATSLVQAYDLNGAATVTSLACDPSGHCVAGGAVYDGPSVNQAFVADGTNGTWTTTRIATSLNTGGSAEVYGVACETSGHCFVGGYYSGANNSSQAFVAEELNGAWSVTTVASSLNTGDVAQVSAVACSASQCEAGGYYYTSGHRYEAFVADEVNGVWSATATATSLNVEGDAGVNALACSAGQCAAGGYYFDASFRTQAFVTTNELAPARLTSLNLSRAGTTINAAWSPVGGASYTCTLLYGYASPSSFSVTTTSPSCSFYGVSATMAIGVRVVASSGGVASAPVEAFLSAEPSITCVRGTTHRVVSGVNPRCPAGWRRLS